jgi:Signal transduction histidine kinase
LCKSLLKMFLPKFQEHGVTYYLNAPRSLNLRINPIEIKQILHNIIANASLYTKNNGEFEIDIYELDEYVHIEAYNDIDEQQTIDFERVFDLFYYVQGQSATSNGIGMFTIKAMVDANEGTCTFAPHNEGVLLHITLPLKSEEEFDEKDN